MELQSFINLKVKTYYNVNSLYNYPALNDMPGLECKILLIPGNSTHIYLGYYLCIIYTSTVKQEYL